jgi:predicted ATPase
MPADTIRTLVKELQGMKSRGAFSPFIDYIVFPKFRRIAPGERISFNFPVTVLIGQNGSGKSSVLQALAGAPEGFSVGKWWFGTAVDPIDTPSAPEEQPTESGGGKKKLTQEEQARFWYGYKGAKGEERQAIKQRVRRENDPDNWEPSRYAEKYGMTVPPTDGKDRHPQIDMNAEYLSLRLYLSAFDRCFNFLSRSALLAFQREEVRRREKRSKGQKGGRKQAQTRDYIRHRSRRLDRAFSSNGALVAGKNALSDAPEDLSAEVLAVVRNIVGKDYLSGRLVRHRLYETWGDSVRFSTTAGNYTEANAGSGETAVVMIARLFEKAPMHSLLLLDEPETSLHPGAQVRLLEYILNQTKKKKLQVVISTHAPALIKHLPSSSVKVLRSATDGLVRVTENVAAEDAFYEIGEEFVPGCNIVVEDRLAKALLEAIAAKKGAAFAANVHIRFGPGGDSAMKQDAVVYIKDPGSAPVLVFDGDKQKPHKDPAALTVAELDSATLDKIIKDQTGVTVKFTEDSNMSAERKNELRVNYLKYYKGKVFYLPFDTPEGVVWNDEAAKHHLAATLAEGEAEEAMRQITAEPDAKKKFAKLATSLGHLDIGNVHAMFVKRFVSHGHELCTALEKLLKDAVDAAGSAHA